MVKWNSSTNCQKNIPIFGPPYEGPIGVAPAAGGYGHILDTPDDVSDLVSLSPLP